MPYGFTNKKLVYKTVAVGPSKLPRFSIAIDKPKDEYNYVLFKINAFINRSLDTKRDNHFGVCNLVFHVLGTVTSTLLEFQLGLLGGSLHKIVVLMTANVELQKCLLVPFLAHSSCQNNPLKTNQNNSSCLF